MLFLNIHTSSTISGKKSLDFSHKPIKFDTGMNDTYILQINAILYPFIKKLLEGSSEGLERNKDTEDIIQESWKKFLENYPQFYEDEVMIRSLIFVIAKREAIQYLRKKKRFIFTGNQYNYLLNGHSHSNIYENLIKSDMQIILQMLPENYAFIWEKSLDYESSHSQSEILKIIGKEYKKKFGETLTIANYRQLKRRAGLKIAVILTKEGV